MLLACVLASVPLYAAQLQQPAAQPQQPAAQPQQPAAQPQQAAVQPQQAAAQPQQPDSDNPISPDYRIGVGDVLNIQVWKETDLTRSVPVRPDGKISFPLLDDLQAAGLTPLELKRILTDKLKQYLSGPRVTVLVEEVNSYKVYVMGEVVLQGSLVLKTRTTLLQAISLAGGFTAYAKRDQIIVLRKNGKKDERIKLNYDRIISGKSPEQNLVLEPGDTVVVP
jgi:polysaccharide export outer membrane protein